MFSFLSSSNTAFVVEKKTKRTHIHVCGKVFCLYIGKMNECALVLVTALQYRFIPYYWLLMLRYMGYNNILIVIVLVGDISYANVNRLFACECTLLSVSGSIPWLGGCWLYFVRLCFLLLFTGCKTHLS